MNSKTNYKKHITGLKGLACVMIMVGHFLGLFVFAENMPLSLRYFNAVRYSKVGFVLDGSFWLYLFFIVSGYLLANSKIENLQQLFAKCVQRFLRLGLPILFAYIILFVLYKTIGFHNAETVVLFENSWYQETLSDRYSVLDVIFSPIYVLLLGKCSLIAPYWVLRGMFISSIMIYVTVYLLYRLPDKPIIKYGLIGVGLILSKLISDIPLCCFLGAILGWCQNDIKALLKGQFFFFAIVLFTFSLPAFNQTYTLLLSYMAFFATLIICIPKIKFLNSIFSSRLFESAGKISFGIYSFHWPLYCSVGALIIMAFSAQIGLLLAVLCAMVICFFVTLVLAWLYHISFEKLSNFISKTVYNWLSKPFKLH